MEQRAADLVQAKAELASLQDREGLVRRTALQLGRRCELCAVQTLTELACRCSWQEECERTQRKVARAEGQIYTKKARVKWRLVRSTLAASASRSTRSSELTAIVLVPGRTGRSQSAAVPG
eukprot:1364458-Rhodomonas_salina.2